MARIINGIEGLRALAGQDLGHSEWMTIDQARVSAFADVTLDHQWIHLDAARAKAESPFGGTVAHGFLTLSVMPHLLDQVIQVTGVKMAVNYGLNKLRFPAPVVTGSRIRLGIVAPAVEEIRGGVQIQLDCTIQVEGSEKPALVAEVLFRYYG